MQGQLQNDVKCPSYLGRKLGVSCLSHPSGILSSEELSCVRLWLFYLRQLFFPFLWKISARFRQTWSTRTWKASGYLGVCPERSEKEWLFKCTLTISQTAVKICLISYFDLFQWPHKMFPAGGGLGDVDLWAGNSMEGCLLPLVADLLNFLLVTLFFSCVEAFHEKFREVVWILLFEWIHCAVMEL